MSLYTLMPNGEVAIGEWSQKRYGVNCYFYDDSFQDSSMHWGKWINISGGWTDVKYSEIPKELLANLILLGVPFPTE